MQHISEFLLLIIVAVTSFFSSLQGFDTEPVPIESEVATVLRVIDGDTIVVLIDGTEEKVRYVGIDTPERSRGAKNAECGAAEATAQNETLVLNRQVRLERDVSDRDQYGRLLRYVYTDEGLVQERLVEQGLAEVFYYKPDVAQYRSLKQLEEIAKDNQVGNWGLCAQ